MLIRVTAGQAGRFISRGYGSHVTRTIPSWELIVVLKGELKMFLGRQHVSVPPRHALLLPAGVRHGGDTPYGGDLSFYWLHVFPVTQKDKAALERLPAVLPIPKPERASQFLQLFLSLQDDALPDRTELDLIAQLILRESTRGNTSPNSGSTPNPDLPPLLQQLRKLLILRFRDPLTTSYLAQKLQCNPDYLGRLHQRHCHETISGALNRIRMEHAATLLRTTNQTINEIAYNVGFIDLRYFRRVFYHFYAMPPTAYRKLMAPEHINTE